MGSALMIGDETSVVDYGDVQGLVRFAHNRLTAAYYLLLRIADARSARAWLRSAAVTTAATVSPLPDTALQVAFTASGLRALGIPETVLVQFSDEFLSGMSGSQSRSRRLGDEGANAPQNWTWGTAEHEPHLLVAFFAEPQALDACVRSLQTPQWNAAFVTIATLDTSNLGGVEQFGFTDGISQPDIDWQQQRNLRGDKPEYENSVAIGEFLLGYPNEYDCETERPLLDPGGVNDLLAPAREDPAKRDLGLNGTYLVLRDLRQDVRAFWSFAKSEELASMFVGRHRDGTPLVRTGGTNNDFTYARDPDAIRCPFGAHIRRTNPRNGDFPQVPFGPIATGLQMLGFRKSAFHDDLTSSVRFHRILRRGREYGPGLTPADAQLPPPANDPPRGLRFVCLNANIGRQFEFLQNAWIASDFFNGLVGEADPLLGNREPGLAGESTDAFVLNRAHRARRRVPALPQFVTVTGGAYFFLPSLRGLRYFAQAGEEGSQ
ncbi:MAG: hypothetical protein WBV40_07585 [Candidatus Cybelea sp.]